MKVISYNLRKHRAATELAALVERAARSLHTAFGLDSGQAYSAPLPERK